MRNEETVRLVVLLFFNQESSPYSRHTFSAAIMLCSLDAVFQPLWRTQRTHRYAPHSILTRIVHAFAEESIKVCASTLSCISTADAKHIESGIVLVHS